MTFLEQVKQAIKTLVKRANSFNLKTKYLYLNIQKEINRNDLIINDFEDLKKVKFIKQKSLKAIKELILKENITEMNNNNSSESLIILKDENILQNSTSDDFAENLISKYKIDNLKQEYKINSLQKNKFDLKVKNEEAFNYPKSQDKYDMKIKNIETSSSLQKPLESHVSDLKYKNNEKSSNYIEVNEQLKKNFEPNLKYKNIESTDHSQKPLKNDNFDIKIKNEESLSSLQKMEYNNKHDLLFENKESSDLCKLNCENDYDLVGFNSDISSSIIIVENICNGDDYDPNKRVQPTRNSPVKFSAKYSEIKSQQKVPCDSKNISHSENIVTYDSENFSHSENIVICEGKNISHSENLIPYDSKNISKSENKLKNDKKSSKIKSKREYIPGHRTAAYAILRVIHEFGASHKHFIALKAAQFTDTEFDASQKFSGFSAFKILEKKNLIQKESKSKYSLTKTGQDLAQRIFSGSEEIPHDTTVKLIIDSRERKGGRDRIFFQGFFTSKGILNDTRHLGLGDFVWVKGENILNCIIERKQGTDFASSISDGRYREQKRRLKLFNMNVYYIVENMKYNEINKNLVQYCLAETKADSLTVIETEDAAETCFVIETLDKQIREGKYSETMSYGSFLDEGGKNSDLNANKVLLVALLGVKGLNNKRAVELCEKYGTMGEFLSKAEEPGFEKELANTKIGGKPIGLKLAQRIINMLS